MKDMKKKGRQNKGEDHHLAKLTKERVKVIRERYASGMFSQAALAAEFGISQVLVSQVILQKVWKHIS